MGATFRILPGSVRGWLRVIPPPSSQTYVPDVIVATHKRSVQAEDVLLSSQDGTCRCLAVFPVEVSGVDAGLQRARDRVGPSLDVGLKEFSVQLSYGVQTHLQRDGHTMLRQQNGETHPAHSIHFETSKSLRNYILFQCYWCSCAIQKGNCVAGG